MSTAKKVSHPPSESAQSAEMFESLFVEAMDPALICDERGQIVMANYSLGKSFGFQAWEIEDQNVDLFLPTTETPHRSKALSRQTLKTEGLFEDMAVCDVDQQIRVVDVQVRKFVVNDHSLNLVIFRDTEEKKRVERELIKKHGEIRQMAQELEKKTAELKANQELLIQAGKMTALGEMAAGIAHELNQPLQAIRGYSQELSHSLQAKLSPSEKESFGEIVHAADRLAQIIKHMRSHIRQEQEMRDWVQVPDVVENAFRILKKQFETLGIQTHFHFEQNLKPVHIQAIQLEQVLINLATNARDAIALAKQKSGQVRVTVRNRNDSIEIEFQDNGAGMSPETRTKMFQPFFTTKSPGQGMGLGLSISYGALSKMEGSIRVESTLGQGTTFWISLPTEEKK
jgi:PAS domain S-box-containing protein